MSFRLSVGTLDTLAGVFAPTRNPRTGSAGGGAKAAGAGGAMLGFVAASLLPTSKATAGGDRATGQTKRAFGGSTQSAASRRAIATMERTARRAPEVMVRITGRQHGGSHVLANLAYIARLGHGPDKTLGLVTSEGDTVRDGDEMQQIAREWHDYEMSDDARRKGATSLSMILSMPSGTDPEKVKAAALDFANEEFANRSWVASLHVDRDHPHVHLTVARRDHDGRRFHPNRDDLFRYRQRFAQKLRDRGIDANATPAKARGIDPRHDPIAARKIRDKGGVPEVDRARARRAGIRSADDRNNPAAVALRERHLAVRSAYERSIAELKGTPSLVNKAVAQGLQKFIDSLPDPQPNSVRQTRHRASVPIESDMPIARVEAQRSELPDPLAVALVRLKAAGRKGEASFAELDRLDARSVGSEGAQHPAPPDRPRHGADGKDAEPGADTARHLAETLRQVEERDRSRRERDRARERGPDPRGPRR